MREESVDIGGKIYTIASDDSYLDYVKNGFEPHMVQLFRAVASDSDVVLDIGANIGCTAILFAELAKKCIAFEPSPTTYTLLVHNLARAGAHNVIPLNIGLGEESGEFPLTLAPSNRSGAYVSNQTQAGDGYTVERINIRRLDDVLHSLQLPKVDFMKIDVEGFEGQVLRGALQMLAASRPVVALELNHWCLNAFQRTTIPDFFDFLRSVFPILYAVEGSGYLDLHNPNDSYVVMYHHILHLRFLNLVAAFDPIQLASFKAFYAHQFTA